MNLSNETKDEYGSTIWILWYNYGYSIERIAEITKFSQIKIKKILNNVSNEIRGYKIFKEVE